MGCQIASPNSWIFVRGQKRFSLHEGEGSPILCFSNKVNARDDSASVPISRSLEKRAHLHGDVGKETMELALL